MAEGLDYLHVYTIHGNLDGVCIFIGSIWASQVTFGQSSILIDHDCHARLTDFEFSSIVHGMNSVAQKSECTTVWAAPEILNGAGTITLEADVFAFGMVMIEVGLHALPYLVSEIEVRLTSEWCLRLLREGLRSANSQPQSSLQGSSTANDQPVRKRRKNWV